MNKLQLSNSREIRRQFLAFTLEKISNSGEVKGISKLSIWCSARADDRNTFSFVCVWCETCTPLCFAVAFMSGLYMINSICSCIHDAFIKISCVFLVDHFIVGNLFFLIDCLDSPAKLSCYTDILVKYREKLIFLQMSVSDLLQASFQ